eukprot:GHVP01021362.1.p1 GENE.GHVP01021362.1~~GHVP01021362.1.p1  ORF type:complete len:1761 (+),score=339.48 GHVP01021362.1:215-5284(+)
MPSENREKSTDSDSSASGCSMGLHMSSSSEYDSSASDEEASTNGESKASKNLSEVSSEKKPPVRTFRIRLRTGGNTSAENSQSSADDRKKSTNYSDEESSSCGDVSGVVAQPSDSEEDETDEMEWIHTEEVIDESQEKDPTLRFKTDLVKNDEFDDSDDDDDDDGVMEAEECMVLNDEEDEEAESVVKSTSNSTSNNFDMDSLLQMNPRELSHFSALMQSAIEDSSADRPIMIDDESPSSHLVPQVIDVPDDSPEAADEFLAAEAALFEQDETAEEEVTPPQSDSEDEEVNNLEIMTIYRRNQWLKIGADHPELLAESGTLAAVRLPWKGKSLELRIPMSVVRKNDISNPQLECVLYAARSFTSELPSGHQKGYFLGEGTGCGKGRIISCTIWHLWNKGQRRHVWVSVSNDLAQDAMRDLRDAGAAHIPVLDLGNAKLLDLDSVAGMKEAHQRVSKFGWDWNGEGVLFCTYTLLARNIGKEGGKDAVCRILEGESQFNNYGDINKPSENSPSLSDFSSIEVDSRLAQVVKWMSLTPPWARKLNLVLAEYVVTAEDDDEAWQQEAEIRRMSKRPRDRRIQRGRKSLKKYYAYEPEQISPGGLLCFDEAHKAKNLSLGQERSSVMVVQSRTKKGSSNGAMVNNLQNSLKHCSVLYASATGASEPKNMAYMNRLGLWGKSTNFQTFQDFKQRIDSGGFPAMECLAMDLKSQGMYSCRTLSYYDIKFVSNIVHSDDEFCQLYNDTARLLQDYKKFLDSLTDDNSVDWSNFGGPSNVNGNNPQVNRRTCASRRRAVFWSTQQRIFKQLLVCQKVSKAVEIAQKAVEDGKQIVISLWGTGESRTTEKIKEMTKTRAVEDGDMELDNFLSPPKLMLEKLIHSEVPITDSMGNVLHHHQAALERLKRELEAIDLPKNALDELIDRLGGPSKVAEMSGRTKRLVMENGKVRYINRDTGTTPLTEKERIAFGSSFGGGVSSVNVKEQQLFQSGRKPIAIITEAASAGISLHCDRKLANPKPRLMICLELPWAADKAIQQFGRIHRSNQKHSPNYILLVTDVGGERRFVACIARRMKTLGAITRGDRRAAFGSKSDETSGESSMPLLDFDVYSRWGYQALNMIFRALRKEMPTPRLPPAVATGEFASLEIFFDFMKQELGNAGMELDDPEGGFGRKPNGQEDRAKLMDKFLNRMLMMPIHIQSYLFDWFSQVHDDIVEAAKSNGDFDKGVENLNTQYGTTVKLRVKTAELLCTDPKSGAKTWYYELATDRGISWDKAKGIMDHKPRDEATEGFYWYTQRNGTKRLVALVLKRSTYQTSATEISRVLIYKPNVGVSAQLGNASASLENLLAMGWVKALPEECINEGSACIQWKHQYVGSAKLCTHRYMFGRCKNSDCRVGMRIQIEHILMGNIIGLWTRLEAWLREETIPEDTEDGATGAPPRPVFPTTEPPIATKRLRLVKASVDGGLSLVGARIPSSKVQLIRRNLEMLSKQKIIDEDIKFKARAAVFQPWNFVKVGTFIIEALKKEIMSERFNLDGIFTATDKYLSSYKLFDKRHRKTLRTAFAPEADGQDTLGQFMRVLSECEIGLQCFPQKTKTNTSGQDMYSFRPNEFSAVRLQKNANLKAHATHKRFLEIINLKHQRRQQMHHHHPIHQTALSSLPTVPMPPHPADHHMAPFGSLPLIHELPPVAHQRPTWSYY